MGPVFGIAKSIEVAAILAWGGTPWFVVGDKPPIVGIIPKDEFSFPRLLALSVTL
jgi:hypothetical protein